jgi:hypothetical protein
MEQKSNFVKMSVSMPEPLWAWVKRQRTNTGSTVPASRVIATAVEFLRKQEAKIKR